MRNIFLKKGLTMKKIALVIMVLCLNLGAVEISFWGGTQRVNSENAANLVFDLKSNGSGYASGLQLDFVASNSAKIYDASFMIAGWQFGDGDSEYGAIRVLPLGAMVAYVNNDESDKSIYGAYKAVIEYQKDDLFIDNLSFNASLAYVKTLASLSFSYDFLAKKFGVDINTIKKNPSKFLQDLEDGKYDKINGNDIEFKKEDFLNKNKPSGVEFSVGVDYMIMKYFFAGLKLGYVSIKDKSANVAFKDGFNARLGVGFKF